VASGVRMHGKYFPCIHTGALPAMAVHDFHLGWGTVNPCADDCAFNSSHRTSQATWLLWSVHGVRLGVSQV